MVDTLGTLEDVIKWFLNGQTPIGICIDTLTMWSSGVSGLRPADRWLRSNYPISSVVAPNSLRGAMSLNGMAVIGVLRNNWNSIIVSESHPKVLYYALTKRIYNWSTDFKKLIKLLRKLLSFKLTIKTEHEWDALISAYGLLQGMNGIWKNDLHQLPAAVGMERLISPFGKTNYYWPL